MSIFQVYKIVIMNSKCKCCQNNPGIFCYMWWIYSKQAPISMFKILPEKHIKLTLGIKISHGLLAKSVEIVLKPFTCGPTVKSGRWSLGYQWCDKSPKVIMTIATLVWWTCQDGQFNIPNSGVPVPVLTSLPDLDQDQDTMNIKEAIDEASDSSIYHSYLGEIQTDKVKLFKHGKLEDLDI